MLAAITLFDNGLFRMSVSMSTLAIDLLLKSMVFRLDRTSDFLMGHDHIGMFRLIEKRYPKPELRTVVKLSRKYFNDTRYSNNENLSAYTDDFARDFIGYTQQIKDFIDTDCQASLDDLQALYH